MAKKLEEQKTTANGGMLNMGEIGTIRNILMGQQMSEYAQRFQTQEHRIAELEQAINNRIDELAKQTDDRFDRLEKEVANRFDKIERLLSDQNASLNNKIEQTSSHDKVALGQLLGEMSKKLLEG